MEKSVTDTDSHDCPPAATLPALDTPPLGLAAALQSLAEQEP